MTPKLTSARESVRPDPEVVARAKAEDWARRRAAARRRIIRTAERAGIDPGYFLGSADPHRCNGGPDR